MDRPPSRAQSRSPGRPGSPVALVLAAALWMWLGMGCSTPIGVERVSTRQAQAEAEDGALRTGRPGNLTRAVLHQNDLLGLARRDPDEAVRRLHELAVARAEPDLLFALAEMSFLAGEELRRSVKPWETRDERDFYLGAAVYAGLYLFGDERDPFAGVFDRRFRMAADLYNRCLGLALVEPGSRVGEVRLENGRRRLPVGELELRIAPGGFADQLSGFGRLLLADQFRVRGLSILNRQAGLGVPLIGEESERDPQLGISRCAPATLVMRLSGSAASVLAGREAASLELYSPYETTTIRLAGRDLPLEADWSVHRAYLLNHSAIWRLGPLQFLAPGEHIDSQLYLNQPFDPQRIPVVLVHGTFSSPVTWAEMANTLTTDPEFRERYQFWTFFYGSGNPLIKSISEFRSALEEKVQELDPAGTNSNLRQMVIIGHSQGGLLTKATVTSTGDRLLRIALGQDSRPAAAELEKLAILSPLPFVRRVVFIATPHRGSYLARSGVRRLASRVLHLPERLASGEIQAFRQVANPEIRRLLGRRLPTSLDSMSPKNPVLQAMADIPVAPGIRSHSIIPVRGSGDPRRGRDGVVAYASAHLDYVDSECVVRGSHTCLGLPATIREVRRILHEHLAGKASPAPVPGGGGGR